MTTDPSHRSPPFIFKAQKESDDSLFSYRVRPKGQTKGADRLLLWTAPPGPPIDLEHRLFMRQILTGRYRTLYKSFRALLRTLPECRPFIRRVKAIVLTSHFAISIVERDNLCVAEAVVLTLTFRGSGAGMVVLTSSLRATGSPGGGSGSYFAGNGEIVFAGFYDIKN